MKKTMFRVLARTLLISILTVAILMSVGCDLFQKENAVIELKSVTLRGTFVDILYEDGYSLTTSIFSTETDGAGRTCVALLDSVKQTAEGDLFQYTTTMSSIIEIEGKQYRSFFPEVKNQINETVTELTIPETFGDQTIEGVMPMGFWGLTGLQKLTVPANVRSIGAGAFAACTSLNEIVFHEGVQSIEDGAFGACSALTGVTLPASVTAMGEGVFGGCNAIQSINVAEGSTSLRSVNGDLYSLDGTRFLQYACGKEDTAFAMPDTVTRVDWGAFFGAERLESLAVPFDGIEESGETCLYNLNHFFGGNIFKNATVVGYAPTDGAKVSAHIFAGDAFTSAILNSVEIPESLKHLTITSCKKLMGNAFGNARLETVTLPENLEQVTVETFLKCGSLQSVTFADAEGWKNPDGEPVDLSDPSSVPTVLRAQLPDAVLIKE